MIAIGRPLTHGATAFSALFVVLAAGCAVLESLGKPHIQVYPARKIITMDSSNPVATAVAVEGERILRVADLESVTRWLGDRRFEIDRRFESRVLLPGFIEPHLHPYIAGILLPMAFITPHDWKLPGRHVAGVRGRDAYLARLREVESELDRGEWLWTWGYHHLYHGRVVRSDLDAISRERPIIVWHRSFHEIVLNSAALEALELRPEDTSENPFVDLANGHFFESGLQALLPALRPHLFSLRRYARALREARGILHAGGITTVSDGAFGTLDLDQEWLALRFSSWNARDTPFRTVLLPDGRSLGLAHGHDESRALIEGRPP